MSYTCARTSLEVAVEGATRRPAMCAGCNGLIWSLGYPHHRCSECGSRFHRGCLSSGVSQSLPFHPHNTHFIEGSIVPCPPPDPGAGPDAEGPPGSSRRSGGWMQPSRHGSDDSDPDSQLTVMTVSQVYNIPNPNLTLTQPLPRPRLSANCDAGIPDIITLTLI